MQTKIKCEVPFCQKYYDIEFKGHKICENCWIRHCNEEINLNKTFEISERKLQTEITNFF